MFRTMQKFALLIPIVDVLALLGVAKHKEDQANLSKHDSFS